MRKTQLLDYVLEIIKNHNSPISVPDLQFLLEKENIIPNKTSLYRILEKLKQKKLIKEVLLNSKTLFYEIKNQHHHHHFVCNNCKKIQCIQAQSLEKNIHSLEKTLEKNGLKIFSHQFSFFGECSTCFNS